MAAEARPDSNPKSKFGMTKPSLSLIPPVALVEEAAVFGLGAAKYGPYNWRDTSVSARVYLDGALRHIASWQDGESIDPESGASHLAHARACIAIILDAMAVGKLIDDRPVAGGAAQRIRELTKTVDQKLTAGEWMEANPTLTFADLAEADLVRDALHGPIPLAKWPGFGGGGRDDADGFDARRVSARPWPLWGPKGDPLTVTVV